jgi:hypothetical protein
MHAIDIWKLIYLENEATFVRTSLHTQQEPSGLPLPSSHNRTAAALLQRSRSNDTEIRAQDIRK